MSTEPEIWRVQITDASNKTLATLHWISPTEYHVYVPDGQLVGAVEKAPSDSWEAWSGRADVMGRDADMYDHDPLVLAARLAQEYEEHNAKRFGGAA